jgi:exosortase/archaeosortase
MQTKKQTLETKLVIAEWKFFTILCGVLCFELLLKVHNYKGTIFAVAILLIVFVLYFLYSRNRRNHENKI